MKRCLLVIGLLSYAMCALALSPEDLQAAASQAAVAPTPAAAATPVPALQPSPQAAPTPAVSATPIPTAQPSPGQATDQLDSKTRKIMDDAAKNGAPLVVSSSVAEKADVEAVLLPYAVTLHVFGREVADNYAAVEVTILNHTPDQSLVVQSIFIDYSQWALGGGKFLEDIGPPQMTQFQKANKPGQISSAEYRVVRGEALDAQPWTKRNVTIRALRLAGSIASAFSFVTRDQDIVHGITAFTGQGVPAAETFWPDGTVEQLNRISDLGFKVNKVIPKSSSDIIVAFFPLKRFLTNGLNKLFKKSPALFFSPYALAVDREARGQLRPIFADFVGKENAEKFMKALQLFYMCTYENVVDAEGKNSGTAKGKPLDQAQINSLTQGCEDTVRGLQLKGVTDEDASKILPFMMKFLAHASLNTIRVAIGGDFTLNVNDIPATVNGVELDGGAAGWASSGDQTGTLRGSFLATGTPLIVEAKTLGISITAMDNTGDSTMKVKITLPSPPLKANTTLTFRVDKTNDETKRTVQGQPYTFTVPGSSAASVPLPNKMDVTSAATKDNILTVNGTGFADTADQPLKVLLFANPPKAAADMTLTKADLKQLTPTQIDIDLCTVKGLALNDSAWTVKVQEGSTESAHSAIFNAPSSAKGKCK